MTLTAPEWLTRRGASLLAGSDGQTWFVLFGDRPQYSLAPVPVGGRFGCSVRQAVNGKSVASPSPAPTTEAAMQAGLEELRKALGW